MVQNLEPGKREQDPKGGQNMVQKRGSLSSAGSERTMTKVPTPNSLDSNCGENLEPINRTAMLMRIEALGIADRRLAR